MSPKTKKLGVWLGGEKIAELQQRRWPEIRCRYTDEALDRWHLNSPVISCSLPLGADPRDALAFCKGLLPEGQALGALAARAEISVLDTFELLGRYGRDIAGALIISPEAPDRRSHGVERYRGDGLAEAIGELDEFPLGVHDDSELSLAGLQNKLLLVKLPDGAWGRPLHGRPSTHILKVEDRRFPGLALAEAESLMLAKAVGLTSIDVKTDRFGEIPCLIVSRFDRAVEQTEVLRVHQEDLCQATGTDPSGNRGRAKYERYGGPSFSDAARLLENWAADPQAQLELLARVATFTVLIGNADAHGKNISLLHPTPGEISLAPLYDTVPTVLWPNLKAKLAMSIAGKSQLASVSAADIVKEATSWGLSTDAAKSAVHELIETIVDAASQRASADGGRSVADHVCRRAGELGDVRPG